MKKDVTAEKSLSVSEIWMGGIQRVRTVDNALFWKKMFILNFKIEKSTFKTALALA